MNVTQLYDSVERFRTAIGTVLVGQEPLVDRLLIGLLGDGHLLLEGVPGVAKTLMVHGVAQALNLTYRRIQFTPDLLPADVLGTQIYNRGTGEFSVKQGPIFANVVLADEINRAPAKVQSALLEAMQERQVTIGETTFPLPKPFFVLATQNPIEHEGTYPLPEAQVDRFMMKLLVDYPSASDELKILDRMGSVDSNTDVPKVFTIEELSQLRGHVDGLHVDAKVKQYIVDIVRATRHDAETGLELKHLIQYGASPRATLSLLRAAKGHAFLQKRDYVTPDDVKRMTMPVLRHRVLLSYEAEAEDLTADVLVQRILDHMPVP